MIAVPGLAVDVGVGQGSVPVFEVDAVLFVVLGIGGILKGMLGSYGEIVVIHGILLLRDVEGSAILDGGLSGDGGQDVDDSEAHNGSFLYVLFVHTPLYYRSKGKPKYDLYRSLQYPLCYVNGYCNRL